MGKNISKSLSSKYSQKILDHTKKSVTAAPKTAWKRAIGNKIAEKIIRVSKTSSKNNPETNEEEIFREKFIPSELRQKLLMI